MHAVLMFLLILVVVWVWTNVTKRRPEVPDSLKRTSRWKILFRLTCIPLAVLGFWAALFQFLGAPSNFVLAWITGGLICLVFLIGLMWAITNIGTFICSPRNYWLWRKGGGDPWFCTLPEPFNTDDEYTRFQETLSRKGQTGGRSVVPSCSCSRPSRRPNEEHPNLSKPKTEDFLC